MIPGRCLAQRSSTDAGKLIGTTPGGHQYISDQVVTASWISLKTRPPCDKSCTNPHFLDVSEDLATQSLLRVGEATGCEENDDTVSEAHDDEIDDGCTTEIPAGRMRGIMCAVLEGEHKLSRRLKVARRPAEKTYMLGSLRWRWTCSVLP